MIIIPPVVLFLDDGVSVYTSVEDVGVEAIDVRNHPEWHGFDSQFHGIRLNTFSYERKFFGFSSQYEGVRLSIDPSMSLNAISDTVSDQMREYLLSRNLGKSEDQLIQLSAKDLFCEIIKEAADRKLKSE